MGLVLPRTWSGLITKKEQQIVSWHIYLWIFSSYSKSLSKWKIALHCRVPPPRLSPLQTWHSYTCPAEPGEWCFLLRRRAHWSAHTRDQARPLGEMWSPSSLSIEWLWLEPPILSGCLVTWWSAWNAYEGFLWIDNTGHSLFLDLFHFLPWLPFISMYTYCWASQLPLLDFCLVILSFIARTSLQIPSMCLAISATCF